MCVLLGILKKHGRSLLCTTTAVHDIEHIRNYFILLFILSRTDLLGFSGKRKIYKIYSNQLLKHCVVVKVM